MNEFKSKSTNRKKYLIWTLFADDDDDNAYNIFKIQEFRLCDCYLDWILHFQLRNKETIFSNEFTTAFFDDIPLEGNDIAADCDFPLCLVKFLSFVVKERYIISHIKKTFHMKNFTMNV